MKRLKRQASIVTLIALVAITTLAATGCGESSSDPYMGIQYSQYITLPDYSQVQLATASPEEVTEDEITEEILSRLSDNATDQFVGEGTVEEGDEVNISFKGYLSDGTTKDIMNSDSYVLILGSSTMIDGFDESMYGAKVGDTVTANLQYPESYPKDADLAGQDVTFEITILAKKDTVDESVSDYIAETDGIETEEDLREMIRSELQASADKTALDNVKLQILDDIIEDTEVIQYPEDLVQVEYDKADAQYRDYCDTYSGQEWENFLSDYLGLTEEEYDEQITTYAQQMVKNKLVIYALAKAEGIDFPEEDYEYQIKITPASYGYGTVSSFEAATGMTVEEYEEQYYNYYGLRSTLMMNQVVNYLYDLLS